MSEVLLSCPELPSARRAWTQQAYVSPIQGSGGGWELECAVDEEKLRELGLCGLWVRS